MGKVKYFYNYEVCTDQNERFRFKERSEITNAFGISLSSIRHIIKNLHNNRCKWRGYSIKRIHEPILNHV
jgi:hypothetical protein